jgi:hypothetical protein
MDLPTWVGGGENVSGYYVSNQVSKALGDYY